LLKETRSNPKEFAMNEVLAHVTQFEVPGYCLAAFAGFIAGVAVTFAMLARKTK
jgi:hypothetical protein